MGLSRNKVAVSEGAAGSPPFYGDNTESPKDKRSDEIETKVPISQEAQKTKIRTSLSEVKTDFVVRFSGYRTLEDIWGCSSVGRAPALQAGGQEFESLHLHQGQDEARTTHGLIAQQARACA